MRQAHQVPGEADSNTDDASLEKTPSNKVMAHSQTITESSLNDYRDVAVNRRRISWGAIFAGTVAAVAVQLLLTLLGISIGAWVANPASGPDNMQGIGIGAGIWALASFILSLFTGGWIAGRMAGLTDKLDGLLEGFLVWSAVTALSFMFLTNTIGGILGGAAGLAGNIINTAPEAGVSPQATMRDIQTAVQDPQVRSDVQERAQAVTQDVARSTATGSFWAFLALLLGALAASFAGRIGGASGLRTHSEIRTLSENR
jgi:hypothetical protein